MKASPQLLVLGLGLSGRACLRLAVAKGIAVAAWDENPSAEALALLEELGLEIFSLPLAPDHSIQEVVISPGFALDHPLVSELSQSGLPLVSTMEFGWRHRPADIRCIAVTGSLGKSTVVASMAIILEEAGLRAIPCGNYGLPTAELALRDDLDVWVIEASSFQLETIRDFAPDASLLLNLKPNHLTRHRNMAGYLAAKLRMFTNRLSTTPAWSCEQLRPQLSGYEFSFFGTDNDAQATANKGFVSIGEVSVSLKGSLFDNPVLQRNAAGMIGLLIDFGVSEAAIQRGLHRCQPLEHRLQPVPSEDGIRWVNDSKSTCLAASVGAVSTFEGERVHLILGGRSKEKSLDSLKDFLANPLLTIYLFGELRSLATTSNLSIGENFLHETLANAVRHCRSLVKAGDVVLFSPGCASFDQFRNYQERGRQFVDCVQLQDPFSNVK